MSILKNKVSMPKLTEQTVQRAAQEYLLRHYKRGPFRKVYSQLEARTKKKIGGKRADGLIAFKHIFWGTFVASMEAKSYNTLVAIKPYTDYKLFFINSLKAGILFCILTGAFFYLFNSKDLFVQFMLPLNMILMGAFIYVLLTLNSTRNMKAKVLEQLSQYPGNHQWLAISLDSFEALSEKKQKNLKILCRNAGIGLLVIQNSRKVKAYLKPSTRWRWTGDYLSYYSNELKVRELLAG